MKMRNKDRDKIKGRKKKKQWMKKEVCQMKAQGGKGGGGRLQKGGEKKNVCCKKIKGETPYKDEVLLLWGQISQMIWKVSIYFGN